MINNDFLAQVDITTARCMFSSAAIFEAKFEGAALVKMAEKLANDHKLDKDLAQFRKAFEQWFPSPLAQKYFEETRKNPPGAEVDGSEDEFPKCVMTNPPDED